MQWFPAYHQIRYASKNPSYLNSLWLGTAWWLISLPEILLFLLIVPTLKTFLMYPIWKAPFIAFSGIVRTLFGVMLTPLVGIVGWLSSENISLEQLKARMFAQAMLAAIMCKDDE